MLDRIRLGRLGSEITFTIKPYGAAPEIPWLLILGGVGVFMVVLFLIPRGR